METRDVRGHSVYADRHADWLRRFIEGNYLYFISAALMLLGAYLMMNKGDVPGKGRVFSSMFQGLALLQGYEVLVIGATIFVLRGLRDLDDAFSLLIIELVLLCDPTFFSTMFYMSPTNAGYHLNVICLAVVFLKAPVLMRGSRLRLSRRYWIGLFFVAAVIYLFSATLEQTFVFGRLHADVFHHLVLWVLVLYPIVVLPDTGLVVSYDREARFSAARERALPVWLFCIPPFFLFSHGMANIWVHGLYPGTPIVAPILMGLLSMALMSHRKRDTVLLAMMIDIATMVVLLLIIGGWDSSLATNDPADQTYAQSQLLPLSGILALLAAGGFFLWLYVRERSLGLLLHLISVGFVLLCWVAFTVKSWREVFGNALKRMMSSLEAALELAFARIEVFLESVFSVVGDYIASVFHFLFSHPVGVLCALVVLFCAAAWRWRNYWLVWLSALLAAVTVSVVLSGSAVGGWSTLVQLTAIAWLLVEHLYDKRFSQSDRRVLLFMILTAGTYSFVDTRSVLAGTILAVEVLGALAAGLALREYAYCMLGGLWIVGGMVAGAMWLRDKLSATWIFIGGALLVFAGGLALSVYKQRLLAWLSTDGGDFGVGGDQENVAEKDASESDGDSVSEEE